MTPSVGLGATVLEDLPIVGLVCISNYIGATMEDHSISPSFLLYLPARTDARMQIWRRINTILSPSRCTEAARLPRSPGARHGRTFMLMGEGRARRSRRQRACSSSRLEWNDVMSRGAHVQGEL